MTHSLPIVGPPSTWWSRLRLGAALLIGVPAAAIMLVTVLPVVVMPMVLPSIGGAELAPGFALVGVLVLGLAWGRAPRRCLRRVALALGGLTLGLALMVLVQVPGGMHGAERSMVAAFGPAYAAAPGSGAVPAYRQIRPAPVSLVDVLCGLRLPAIKVSTDVPMFSVAGQTLRADIYHPQTGAGAAPIVMVLHGGSWSSRTRQEGDSCHRTLAASGFLVITVDYRFAPAFPFPAQLDDARAALAWVRAHAAELGGDATRVGVMGRSAGAQLALLSAWAEDEAAPGSVRCAVGFYSPVDLTYGYRHPGWPDPLDARAVFRDFLGGTPDDRPALYRAASPIAQADRRRPPTLLMYGGRDHLVQLRYGAALAEALGAHGTRVALINVPWAEHGFDLLPQGLGGQLTLHHLERFLHLMLDPTRAD